MEGEISEPFETDFGYHVLYVEKIRGQEYDVSHILLFPEFLKRQSIEAAQRKIEDLDNRNCSGELTFAEAARESSDEKETRNKADF